MKIINIYNNFNDEVINSKEPVIVDFWASWCGPCKMFGPIFEKVSQKYNNIKFCKLNVDEDENDIARKLGVMSIPTTIIFKNGKEIKRNVGFLDEDSLINFVENI